jgi:HSP20 family protein
VDDEDEQREETAGGDEEAHGATVLPDFAVFVAILLEVCKDWRPAGRRPQGEYALFVTSRRDVDRLRGEIDDLFSELWQLPRFAARHGVFRPQVDCYRTEKPPQLTIVVELPGVEPSELQIIATPTALLVAGERRRPSGDGRVYLQMEVDYGPFRREITLTEEVDPDGGQASYERGLLTVVLPLAKQPAPPAKVPIEVRIRR